MKAWCYTYSVAPIWGTFVPFELKSCKVTWKLLIAAERKRQCLHKTCFYSCKLNRLPKISTSSDVLRRSVKYMAFYMSDELWRLQAQTVRLLTTVWCAENLYHTVAYQPANVLRCSNKAQWLIVLADFCAFYAEEVESDRPMPSSTIAVSNRGDWGYRFIATSGPERDGRAMPFFILKQSLLLLTKLERLRKTDNC